MLASEGPMVKKSKLSALFVDDGATCPRCFARRAVQPLGMLRLEFCAFSGAEVPGPICFCKCKL